MAREVRQTRSAKDLRPLEADADIADIVTALNDTITYINAFNKLTSLQSSFDCYMAKDVKITAGASIKIQHFLGITPKWRIILRQEGNGVISDIPSGWNTEYITLKNNGAETVTISAMIVRE